MPAEIGFRRRYIQRRSVSHTVESEFELNSTSTFGGHAAGPRRSAHLDAPKYFRVQMDTVSLATGWFELVHEDLESG